MQNRIFHAACFGFALGILVRSYVFINIYGAVFAGTLAIFLILFFSFLSKQKWGQIAGVFVLAVALGICRFDIGDMRAPAIFENSVGAKVELTGQVIDEPVGTETGQKVSIQVKQNGSATILIASVGFDAGVRYGDAVTVSGTLAKPENFITDQGKEFDYVNYLRKDGIFYLMNYPHITVLSHDNGNRIKSILFSAKEKFLEKMNFAIRAPESLLMGGLILGERSSFDQALRQSFVDTGTIHIVALSGYNVSIVAEWIMKVFKAIPFIPHSFGIVAGIAAIALFVVMAGAGSTAVRAGIMAVLALVARATGRNYDVARGLIMAGVGMIALNPLILVYDVSFQLSFIATVAVIFVAPRMEKYFQWITEKGQLRDIVTVTFAAYIFVLPFILYNMGNLSLVALPANMLVLPFIPITMGFGFITGVLGLVWYGLAVPVGYISYLFLHYELWVVRTLSHVSFAALSIANFPLWITLAAYAYCMYALFGRSISAFFTEEF